MPKESKADNVPSKLSENKYTPPIQITQYKIKRKRYFKNKKNDIKYVSRIKANKIYYSNNWHKCTKTEKDPKTIFICMLKKRDTGNLKS